jgi:hypothetical protein
MGVQEMTRFGMKEKNFDRLAGYLADVVIRNRNVREEVKKYRQDFLEMGYCLPAKDAVPLAARIIHTAFPHREFAGRFIENLQKLQ